MHLQCYMVRREFQRTHAFVEKSNSRSSWCRGLSLVSSIISCMGWVGGRDQIWTDSGSQGCHYKLTSDLTQKKIVNRHEAMLDVWYIENSFIHCQV